VQGRSAGVAGQPGGTGAGAIARTFFSGTAGADSGCRVPPLDLAALTGIAYQALDEIGQRLAQNGLGWQVEDNVADWIARAIAQHPANGRAVRELLRQHVLPVVAHGVLVARAEGRTLQTVRLSATDRLLLTLDDGTEQDETDGELMPVGLNMPADAGTKGEPACV